MRKNHTGSTWLTASTSQRMRELRAMSSSGLRVTRSGPNASPIWAAITMPISGTTTNMSARRLGAPWATGRPSPVTGGSPVSSPGGSTSLVMARFTLVRRAYAAAMHGLMQDRPLTLPHFFERAERLFARKEVVTATPGGLHRVTYGEWAARTRRLGGVLDRLGISESGRVATFAWNTARHLELYFAAPCSGRVLHTLNIRLFPEQLTYIVNHAEDEVIFVDRSLLGLLGPLVPTFKTVGHLVVMDDGADVDVPEFPGGPEVHDYEVLLADAAPVEWHVDDENRAASMCYTSGTTGNPKGVVYSHRSTWLHTMGALTADSLGASERDVILPVVPMFHANAWGLAHAGGGVRGQAGDAGRRSLARFPGQPHRDRTGHRGGGRAHHLDGGAAGARRS